MFGVNGDTECKLLVIPVTLRKVTKGAPPLFLRYALQSPFHLVAIPVFGTEIKLQLGMTFRLDGTRDHVAISTIRGPGLAPQGLWCSLSLVPELGLPVREP